MHLTGEMSTGNTASIKELTPQRGAELFARFPPEARNYSNNLVQEWQDQLRFVDKFNHKTVKNYHAVVQRLLHESDVLPWDLRKSHVTACLKGCKAFDGMPAAPQTVSSYCSAWRSFQSFLMDADRANQIMSAFGVRPKEFVNSENSIPIKRIKANWSPAQWALTEEQIDRVEAWFVSKITEASQNRSKSLLPLLRDRVMFHLCIHFALRVSELVTICMEQFRASHDSRLAKFGNFGTLTVTGKNNVTGTIPMREPLIHELLSTYLNHVRPKLLSRAKLEADAQNISTYDEREFLVSQLLFVSERGGIMSPGAFRDRLAQITRELSLPKKLTPHTLRHTGCTLMAPIYSPDVAQKYMRHKNLSTTLYYYHSQPLNAGNHLNPIYGLTLPNEEEDEIEEGDLE